MNILKLSRLTSTTLPYCRCEGTVDSAFDIFGSKVGECQIISKQRIPSFFKLLVHPVSYAPLLVTHPALGKPYIPPTGMRYDASADDYDKFAEEIIARIIKSGEKRMERGEYKHKQSCPAYLKDLFKSEPKAKRA